MSLTSERGTLMRSSDQLGYPAAAGVKVYKGALTVLNAGYAEPGSTATGLVTVGMAEKTVDNTDGADGDVIVPVRRGVFRFANSGTDPIAQADVGADCFVEDDETVAKTDGTNTRSKAGIIRGVEVGGVWVEI